MGGRGVCSLTWPKNGPVRRVFFLILLALLGAAFEARGEGRPAAPSADGNCNVAADTQRWTKQEIFVWQRVCAGAIADFKDRKSTRLNSSHLGISYAVFCLKKKIKKMSRNIKSQKKRRTNANRPIPNKLFTNNAM